MNQPPERLGSWKEIAAFLGVDERTARRYEEQRGLPVHRLRGGARSAVHAYRSELAEWLRERPAEATPPASEALSAVDTPPGVESRARSRRRFVPVWGGLLALAALGLGATIWVARVTSLRNRVPVQVEYRGTRLVALDESRNVLWGRDMPVSPDRVTTGVNPSKLVQLVDVDGDAEPEVLVVVRQPEESSPESDELECLSTSGELLWTYRFDDTLTFGARNFAGPWSIPTFTVGGGPGPQSVWVAARLLWWPSVVIKLDHRGREMGRFVQSGHVFSLGYLRTTPGDFVLVGGVNNERDAGALAILRADAPSGASPQTSGSEFECHGCPPGRPVKYLVFPRTELNRVTSSDFNRVTRIRIIRGGFEVEVLEAYAPPGSGGAALFEFSDALSLRAARFGNSHYDLHRFLSQQKQILHAPEDCPEKTPQVLEWVPDEQNGGASYRKVTAGG